MASLSTLISHLAVTPDQGTYAPGQTITLPVRILATKSTTVEAECEVYRGLELVGRQVKPWRIASGKNHTSFAFNLSTTAPAGYGVVVTLRSAIADQGSVSCQSAFDVLNDWTEFPRYGFVCDFTPQRANAEETIHALNDFHLNGLQFYDWQYRHDSLVPPEEEFTDPLGRALSLKATRDLIAEAHKRGMKAMPYLAIYAASAAFWHAHPEMALYDEKHQLIPFGEEFLGIMNPVKDGGWARHLLQECRHVLDVLPFDGLHIDQYGDPKTGFDEQGNPVDLPKAFADFISDAVRQHPGKPVLFNAVGNWPIDSLAKAPVSFNYIEIWPPKTTYQDVAEIVRNARKLSGEKPVVIALYLPADRPANNRLADAIIFSAGGTRIELGENARLLSDPYFPKHEAISSEFKETLRKQLELIIRYENWISPVVPECPLPEAKLPRGVEPFFRQTDRGCSLSLVNLNSGKPMNWNEDHGLPEILRSFEIELEMEEPVRNIWLVSPDFETLTPEPLRFEQNDNRVKLIVPCLEIWDVLLIETAKERG